VSPTLFFNHVSQNRRGRQGLQLESERLVFLRNRWVDGFGTSGWSLQFTGYQAMILLAASNQEAVLSP
jgi:hypothetical protein